MTNELRSLPNRLKAGGNAVFSTFQQLAGAGAGGTSAVSTIVAAAQWEQPNSMVTGTMTGTQNAFLVLLALTIVMAFFAYTAVINAKGPSV